MSRGEVSGFGWMPAREQRTATCWLQFRQFHTALELDVFTADYHAGSCGGMSIKQLHKLVCCHAKSDQYLALQLQHAE